MKKKNLSNSATYMYSYSVYLYMYVVLFSAGCTEFNFYIVEFKVHLTLRIEEGLMVPLWSYPPSFFWSRIYY